MESRTIWASGVYMYVQLLQDSVHHAHSPPLCACHPLTGSLRRYLDRSAFAGLPPRPALQRAKWKNEQRRKCSQKTTTSFHNQWHELLVDAHHGVSADLI